MSEDAEIRDLVQRSDDLARADDGSERPQLAAVLLDYFLRRGGDTRPAASVRATASVTSETLAEALATGLIRSHPERLLAIAAFRFEHGVESVTTEEFVAAYREVRASRPQNLHANIGICVSRGWLVEANAKEGRKAWRVTQSGLTRYQALLTPTG